MASTESAKATLVELEKTSKQAETELVVDIGVDRMIQWVGVHFLLALAVIAKVAGEIGPDLFCYPANRTGGYDSDFIRFSTAYCWESMDSSNRSSCADLGVRDSLLQRPASVKRYKQAVPYVILLQAVVFAVPAACWHLAIGPRLMGHVKFVQLLLGEIFETVQQIKHGMYENQPYDRDSENFRSWDAYPDATSGNSDASRAAASTQAAEHSQLLDSEGEDVEAGCVKFKGSSCCVGMKKGGSGKQEEEETTSAFSSLIKRVTSTTDRHFFSMICYANFASLHHLPYILSIFKLTESGSDETRPARETYPLLKSLVFLWCHPANFSNNYLVGRYLLKHAFTSAAAAAILAVNVCWFWSLDDGAGLSFACKLPHHDELCLLCTFARQHELAVVFWANAAAVGSVMLASGATCCFVRTCSRRAACCLFERLMRDAHVALDRAYAKKDA